MKNKVVILAMLFVSTNVRAQVQGRLSGIWICFNHPYLQEMSDSHENVEQNEKLFGFLDDFEVVKFDEFEKSDTSGMLLIFRENQEFNVMPFYWQHFDRVNPSDQPYPVPDPLEVEISDPEYSQWMKSMSLWLRTDELMWSWSKDSIVDIFKKNNLQSPIARLKIVMIKENRLQIQPLSP